MRSSANAAKSGFVAMPGFSIGCPLHPRAEPRLAANNKQPARNAVPARESLEAGLKTLLNFSSFSKKPP